MKHISFVEDDLSLAGGLSFAIRKQGYELTLARTSAEAVRLWKNGAYDLVIPDVRINALLRRSDNFQQEQAEPELRSNGIRVSLLRQEVTRNGVLLDLTAGEYKLLCLFMENPDAVLSPEQILGRLWDCDGKYIDNNTLTVYIRRLRTKIEDDPADPQRIVTVRRMGYKWNTAKRGETACRSCGMRSGTKCTAESETWNCLE